MSETKAAPVRPTAERMAQGGVIPNEADMGRPKPWSTFESIQDQLLAETAISLDGFHAANKFMEMHRAANGSGMAGQNWRASVDGSTRDISERQAQAKLRITRWSHGLAPSLFEVLDSVIGFGKRPSTWARDTKRHPTNGREILIAAIEQLARMA